MENKFKKKGMGAVIALAVVILLGVIVLTIAIVSMIQANDGGVNNEDTSLYTLSGATNPTKTEQDDLFDLEETQENGESSLNDVVSTPKNSVNVQAGDVQTEANSKNNNYNPVKEYEKLSKNGDNLLSDHHENKYIKLVSQKFNVDTEFLVAIYSEPDTGNNFVLEFSDKRDEDGNVIKSPETLTRVYQIDKKKNITVATGKTTGNIGVSYAEGTLCFNMVKTLIMPQYPDYFTGVEK